MKTESTGPQAPGGASGSAKRRPINRGLLGRVRLAVEAFPLGNTYSKVEYEALDA